MKFELMSKQNLSSLIVTVNVSPPVWLLITAVVAPLDQIIVVTGKEPSVKNTSTVVMGSLVQDKLVATIESILGDCAAGTLIVVSTEHILSSMTVST